MHALWKYPVHALAYGLGVGLVPHIDGLLGALLGMALYWRLRRLGAGAYAGITAILFLAGIFICGQTAHDMAVIDPGMIVFDETVGFMVAAFLLPAKRGWMTAALVLFVVLDVFKPWPIHLLEDIPATGTAIMADDLGAGLAALAILYLLRRIIENRG